MSIQWTSATTRAKRVEDLTGDLPVAACYVGFHVTQDELSGDLENVVANVVGLHAQRIGVLAAVGLDDQPRGGQWKSTRKPSTFC